MVPYHMKTPLIIVAVIVILASAGWFAYSQGYLGNTGMSGVPMKNSQMLDNGSVTEIITQENVPYFPNANGYYVRPQKEGAYPGVVMIHENRGLRPEIKETAEQLAKEGYLVLAVDLYNGKIAEDQTQARELSSGFDQKTGTANLRAAAAYLREQGATKLASLGWCFGGRQSLELATSGEELDATVVYYGGGMKTSEEELSPITWPVLGVFGDADQAIPVETVKTFEASLNALGVENEIYIYPGVGHAFANPSGMNYAPEETKDAWAKTTAFLKKHLSQ